MYFFSSQQIRLRICFPLKINIYIYKHLLVFLFGNISIQPELSSQPCSESRWGTVSVTNKGGGAFWMLLCLILDVCLGSE